MDRRSFSHRLSGEIHLVSSRTGPFIFGMLEILEVILSFNVGYGVDPSATPRGIAIPFHVDRFGGGHITPSTPFMV